MTDSNLEPKPRKLVKKGGMAGKRDMERLFTAIQQRGEAIPGELAQELGWARSSLAYNLNRLQQRRMIVRMGGGRSTRYRVMTVEDKAALKAGVVPPALKPSEVTPQATVDPTPDGPLNPPPVANTPVPSSFGLKGFFKRLLKG